MNIDDDDANTATHTQSYIGPTSEREE